MAVAAGMSSRHKGFCQAGKARRCGHLWARPCKQRLPPCRHQDDSFLGSAQLTGVSAASQAIHSSIWIVYQLFYKCSNNQQWIILLQKGQKSPVQVFRWVHLRGTAAAAPAQCQARSGLTPAAAHHLCLGQSAPPPQNTLAAQMHQLATCSKHTSSKFSASRRRDARCPLRPRFQPSCGFLLLTGALVCIAAAWQLSRS